MIKRELAKDPKLANQSWDRFLPKLPKKSLSKRRKPHVIHDKRNKPLFPPPQTPRKVDLQMESGEYFMKGWEKKVKEREGKETERIEKKRGREEERMKDFVPPKEEIPKKKRKGENGQENSDIETKTRKRKSEATEEAPLKKVKKRSEKVEDVKRKRKKAVE